MAHLSAKKQRQNLYNSGEGINSLAEVVRQMRLVLYGGRRKKIYRHHVFYRRAVHALFYLQKVLPYASSWKQKQTKPGSLSLSQTMRSPTVIDSEEGPEEAFLRSKAEALLWAAGEAAAMEMSAQRIDTAAVSCAVVTLLAVAGKMLPKS